MTTNRKVYTVRTKDGYAVTWRENELRVEYILSTDSYPFKISMNSDDLHFNMIKSLASDLLDAQIKLKSR